MNIIPEAVASPLRAGLTIQSGPREKRMRAGLVRPERSNPQLPRDLTGPPRLCCEGASVVGTPTCLIRGPPMAELSV
ncbi:hypothetical protein NDU88_005602 [Pleurodeles waltl]|uniref:Uncharacterized protein n=1 Tax=Pleurodeles waltl TaxID=8319 RepID=A0AAV7QF83_PLEWA|nr:hypothetical protein NDU88_005602 [Pleurodeles waltl]